LNVGGCEDDCSPTLLFNLDTTNPTLVPLHPSLFLLWDMASALRLSAPLTMTKEGRDMTMQKIQRQWQFHFIERSSRLWRQGRAGRHGDEISRLQGAR
jgi:hypothetical protein